MKLEKIRILVLIFLTLIAGTSCSYDNPLSIWAENQTTTVFFGTITVGDEDFAGPGFIYGPLNLRWKGDKPLNLVKMTISFPASGKLTADFDCTVDSEDLEDVFPGADDLIVDPGETIENTQVRLICTGASAKSKKDQFLVSGLTKIMGYTGSAGDQKFYKAETKVFLYWFPEDLD